ncbi:MAG: histidine kinase [Verrucomicrobiota bacterium]
MTLHLLLVEGLGVEFTREVVGPRAGIPGGVTGVVQDSRGFYWVATIRGLARFDGAGWQMFTSEAYPILETDNIMCICLDDADALWIFNLLGQVLKLDNGSMEEVTRVAMNNRDVSKMELGPKGMIWCQFRESGEVVMLSDGEFSNAEVEDEAGRIVDFIRDRAGDFWIQTREEVGLWTGRKFEFFSPPNLEDDAVSAIRADAEEGLVVRINRGREVEFLRATASGFKSEPPGERLEWMQSYFVASDGAMWITTPEESVYRREVGGDFEFAGRHHNRIVRYFEDRYGNLLIYTDRLVPMRVFRRRDPAVQSLLDFELLITRWSSRDNARNLGDWNAGNEVELGLGDRRLEIHFGALGPSAPGEYQLETRMKNEEKDWTMVSAGTRVQSYDNLPPGSYLFEVRGKAGGDTEFSQTASLSFAVPYYYWETLWFRALVVGAAFFLGAVALLWRKKALRERRVLERHHALQLANSQEEERKRIAAEMHDSLGQNLLVIQNRSQLGAEDAGDETTRQQFRQLSDVAKEAVAELRSIVKDLRPVHFSEVGLTSSLRSMASRLLDAAGMRFEDKLVPLENLYTEDKAMQIFRIVQEALNNAARHSGASVVELASSVEERKVIVTVTDDGGGFSTDEARSGQGLSNMRERATLIGGEVAFDTGEKGTSVRLELPRTSALS